MAPEISRRPHRGKARSPPRPELRWQSAPPPKQCCRGWIAATALFRWGPKTPDSRGGQPMGLGGACSPVTATLSMRPAYNPGGVQDTRGGRLPCGYHVAPWWLVCGGWFLSTIGTLGALSGRPPSVSCISPPYQAEGARDRAQNLAEFPLLFRRSEAISGVNKAKPHDGPLTLFSFSGRPACG